MDTRKLKIVRDFDETEEIFNYSDDTEYVPPTEEHRKPKRARKKYKQNRPKVSTDWFHRDIVKLIKAIEERPTLWDSSSPLYKLAKTPAWQEVAELMEDRTADDCKAKWSSLRVTYTFNLRKWKIEKSSFAPAKPIVWKYFKSMLFLDPDEASQMESFSFILPDDTNFSMTESEPTTLYQGNLSRPSPAVSSSTQMNVSKEMTAKMGCSTTEMNEKDQFDAFGIHVAAELHSLPLSKGIVAKRKLARALVDIMDEVQSCN